MTMGHSDTSGTKTVGQPGNHSGFAGAIAAKEGEEHGFGVNAEMGKSYWLLVIGYWLLVIGEEGEELLDI
jgi:hypothetical protein